MTRIIERIERELGMPGLAAALAERLMPSDLQSLYLQVSRLRASRKAASVLLDEYEASRYVKPAVMSPLRLLEWDEVAFARLAPEFEPVELSPVCPFGTCSIVAGIAQNWSVSTERNNEVVSDLTNALALEAARRRRQLLQREPRSTQPVHLAASHRVLRAQHYENPKLTSHFRLFGLCSAGRDTGQLGFETQALALHLHFYLAAIRAYLGPAHPLRVALTVFGPLASFPQATESLMAGIRDRFERVQCALDPQRQSGRGYYQGICFHIYAQGAPNEELELADGGMVDWTRKLLSNAKERLVISGIGVERLCAIGMDAAPPPAQST